MRWLPVLALLLVGCLGSSAGEGIEGTRDEWMEPTASLWIVSSTGCGFCIGDPEIAEFDGVLYYRDGRVAAFTYARGTGDGAVTATPEAAPWVPMFEDLVRQTRLYGQTPTSGIRIHSVTTGTLSDEAKLESDNLLDASLSVARTPEDRDDDECADCAHRVVESFGKPLAMRIEARSNNDVGYGWREVITHTSAIQDWLTA